MSHLVRSINRLQKKKEILNNEAKIAAQYENRKKEISLQYEKAQSIVKKKRGDQAKKGNFGIRVD